MKKKVMTATTITQAAPKSSAGSAGLPSAYHRIDALLRTMRCITGYEDALCELSHDVKRSGVLTSEASEELRLILDNIPSHDYTHDLDAVIELLAGSVAPKKTAPKSARKSSPPKSELKGKRKAK